jgi:hypothetical protein
VLIIGTAERFQCGKQMGSYLGLIPCEDSSADQQRLGHISKQGGSLLRFLLVEAAQVAVRVNPEWRRRFLHLAMRRGRKIAKVAMARRVAVGLYWMWRKQWDYQQVVKFGSHVGTARVTPWWAIDHRVVDWASRSHPSGGSSNLVIMIEVAIEEMVGSDRSPPERLRASLGEWI